MTDILSHFPYPEIRPVQEQLLLEIEARWNSGDVFVINAPTALGKSAIASTIMSWQYNASYITPTNQLLDQFLNEFPETKTLRRLDSYICEDLLPKFSYGCPTIRGQRGSFCKGCPAAADLAQAKYKKGPGAYNFHTYMAHKLHRDILIIDEAHQIIPVIQGIAAVKVWKHKEHYPDNWASQNRRPLLEWLHGLPTPKHRNKWWKYVSEALDTDQPQHVIGETTGEWTGGYGDTPRGEAVELPLLEVKPIDIRDLRETSIFLPRSIKKIILMSATIGPQDIEQLGLSRRRVVYLNCASPIPATSRPIIPLSIAAANYQNLEAATKEMCDFIRKELCIIHNGEKGIIHATYRQAEIINDILDADPVAGSRLLFHTKDNKSDVLRVFLDSPPESGTILIASGMYEGVDLPYDLARWQVITKIPWLSLADPAIKYKADKEPNWYLWETLKKVIQACGRVVRTPTDFGTTYILDSTFDRLYRDAYHLAPQWWKDAVDG